MEDIRPAVAKMITRQVLLLQSHKFEVMSLCFVRIMCTLQSHLSENIVYIAKRTFEETATAYQTRITMSILLFRVPLLESVLRFSI